MANMFEIEIKGHRELATRYRGAEAVIRSELMRSVTRIVLQGERESKAIVPTDTHHLQRSIASKATPIGGGVRGVWGTAVPYARYVERGASPHFVPVQYIGGWARRHGFGETGLKVSGRAQPYIKPAFAKVQPLARAEFQQALMRIIAKLQGGS